MENSMSSTAETVGNAHDLHLWQMTRVELYSVGSVLVSPERCMSQLFVHSEISCSITYKPTCIETYEITIKQINGSSNLNLTITFPDTKLSLCSKITKLSIKSLSQVTSKADTLFRHDTLSAFEAHTRHVPRSM